MSRHHAPRHRRRPEHEPRHVPTWHQEELYDVHRLRSRQRTIVVLVMASGGLLLSAALAVLVEGSW